LNTTASRTLLRTALARSVRRQDVAPEKSTTTSGGMLPPEMPLGLPSLAWQRCTLCGCGHRMGVNHVLAAALSCLPGSFDCASLGSRRHKQPTAASRLTWHLVVLYDCTTVRLYDTSCGGGGGTLGSLPSHYNPQWLVVAGGGGTCAPSARLLPDPLRRLHRDFWAERSYLFHRAAPPGPRTAVNAALVVIISTLVLSGRLTSVTSRGGGAAVGCAGANRTALLLRCLPPHLPGCWTLGQMAPAVGCLAVGCLALLALFLAVWKICTRMRLDGLGAAARWARVGMGEAQRRF
jgi:hypothetical protein